MKDCIINTVSEIISTYKTRNPFELCDLIPNVNLYFHFLGDILKGYYLFYNDMHNIVIDNTLSRIDQLIVIGHELGHLFLHSQFAVAFRETGFDNTDKIELEANIFCAELLISDENIISLINQSYPLDMISYEISYPAWLIDCKIQALKRKGYDLPFLYIANRSSIKM